jgi:hypothetical protein
MLANLANGKPWRVFPHWLRARLTPISYGPVTPVTPITLPGDCLVNVNSRCLPFFKDGLASPAAIEHN